MAYVYLLRCADGTLYAGAAKDVQARLRAHLSGRASRYTRARLPVELVWFRKKRTWNAALREEWRIKQLSRAQKLALVEAANAAAALSPPAPRPRRGPARSRGRPAGPRTPRSRPTAGSGRR